MGYPTLGYTEGAQVGYYSGIYAAELITESNMYLPQNTLIILAFTYLLFLLSLDWATQYDGAWYRPFVLCLLVIGVAAWSYREQNSDEL